MHHRTVKHGIPTTTYEALPRQSYHVETIYETAAESLYHVYAYFPLDGAEPTYHKLGIIKKNAAGEYTAHTLGSTYKLGTHWCNDYAEAVEFFIGLDHEYTARLWDRWEIASTARA